MKNSFTGFLIGIFALSILLIIFLATGMHERFFLKDAVEDTRTRIINVRDTNENSSSDLIKYIEWENNLSTKIPLDEGETIIAVLNKESEEGITEEQFVLYRTNTDSFVFITLISYDESARNFKRMWSMPTVITRSDTATLFSQDIIGDRNKCVIVTGMNSKNEHTMTIIRRSAGVVLGNTHRKIAEIQIGGSIIIQETVRPLAYQQGITSGQSFNIAAYGQDSSSSNIMDQIETIYSFSSASGQYEQIRVSRIPGSQIEQQRSREILSGAPGVFENFINDLWYYISPQGSIDTRQYLYFDPIGKEIIFYSEDAQQVFSWQVSTPTRYGLYIRSQNMTINTLFRFIDIELESLDRIRLRVNEDIRVRITANTTWDGSYRRAGGAGLREETSRMQPAIDAEFDSSWGRLELSKSGTYTINQNANIRSGSYIFYNIDNTDLIEMRADTKTDNNRLVYKIENVAGVLILSRVKIGNNGILDLHEPPITLTPVASEN